MTQETEEVLEITEIADRLWYPIWDASRGADKIKLGHAVRTVKEAKQLAGDDLDTATDGKQLPNIVKARTEEAAAAAERTVEEPPGFRAEGHLRVAE